MIISGSSPPLVDSLPAPNTLVLIPPNATVPESGPNGFIGDRVHQAPAFFSICAERKAVLVWPDDVASRTFFSAPNVEFIPGRTAADLVRALKDNRLAEVFCLYSPARRIPPGRDADCELPREADAIVSKLQGINVFQPSRLDPLGDIPIWLQLWNTFHGQREVLALPWFLPTREAALWVSEVLAKVFPGWRAGDPVVIVSPFSGSPKKAVQDAWWREFAAFRADYSILAPVYGDDELEKARILFGGTPVRVIEAKLDQTIALGALPNSEVIGVDGGRLNLLAASREKPVHAFFGIWPASAWALPNVQALPPGSRPHFQPST